MISIAKSDWRDRLETRRRRLKMSKAAVARRSGVSLPTVERVLSGDEDPRFKTIQAIAAALGVSLEVGAETRIVEPATAAEFRKFQAVAKARQLTGLVQGTMGLEAQAVDNEALKEMIDQTTYELLAGSSRRLWDG